MLVSQSSVFVGLVGPDLSMSFCCMSVHSTSNGSATVVVCGWSSWKNVSDISPAEASGSSAICPVWPNCAVRNPPTKMTSSATWTAYAPKRFQAPRSAKTNVLPFFSVTLVLSLRLSHAALMLAATARASPPSKLSDALCSCPRSQWAEASSFLRET